MNPHYEEVALRAGRRCEYCHAPEAVFNLPMEVEHIEPVSRGGGDTSTNWALACRACNLYKATHVSGNDPTSQEIVRLFHPRTDQWEDHFQVVVESGEIEGLTPIGRVTVALRYEQHSSGRSTAAVDASRTFPLNSATQWERRPKASGCRL